jgi:hypothetical protein
MTIRAQPGAIPTKENRVDPLEFLLMIQAGVVADDRNRGVLQWPQRGTEGTKRKAWEAWQSLESITCRMNL